MIEAIGLSFLGAFFWFLLTGLQERYFKPLAIGFWGGVERRVLGSVFDKLDPIFPDILKDLAGKDKPMDGLRTTVIDAILEAEQEIGADLSGEQINQLVQRFGELYNPLRNLEKL
jgi:hypothetical protein